MAGLGCSELDLNNRQGRVIGHPPTKESQSPRKVTLQGPAALVFPECQFLLSLHIPVLRDATQEEHPSELVYFFNKMPGMLQVTITSKNILSVGKNPCHVRVRT